jgi:hypothetical protein
MIIGSPGLTYGTLDGKVWLPNAAPGSSIAFPPRSFPPISLNYYSWHANMMHHSLMLSEIEEEKRRGPVSTWVVIVTSRLNG